MKKWFEIKNKADKAEIWIYEFIGEDYWTGEGITAKSFQKELSGITASQIDLHINSPGGEVFDGITIYNLLKQHKATITTYIDGLAASIASVIALSGDTVIMAENALMMIHNPWGFSMGDADTMRKMAETLDKVAGSILLAYTEKTGMDDAEMRQMMADETWMSAQEAIDMGFADQITEKMDMAACAKFIPAMVKAKYKHIPEDLSGSKHAPDNERDLENFLRDAGGYTRKEAKSIVAEGFKGILRDAELPETPTTAEETLRDAEVSRPAKKDRVSDLLTRAEVVAPSPN
jgi:ATP-dependent Clp endopeptidase proteolytic subunit ClpP